MVDPLSCWGCIHSVLFDIMSMVNHHAVAGSHTQLSSNSICGNWVLQQMWTEVLWMTSPC